MASVSDGTCVHHTRWERAFCINRTAKKGNGQCRWKKKATSHNLPHPPSIKPKSSSASKWFSKTIKLVRLYLFVETFYSLLHSGPTSKSHTHTHTHTHTHAHTHTHTHTHTQEWEKGTKKTPYLILLGAGLAAFGWEIYCWESETKQLQTHK